MEQSQRDEFIEATGVSHETVRKLDRYAELLEEWNQKFNLVSSSTMPHVWKRHFLDSAQLAKFIPEKTTHIADFGSGAGFPGLVLAMMSGAQVHLIESTGKKVVFLRHVIEELGLKTMVHQCRIEEIKDLKPDLVTSRALGSLSDLFKYCSRFLHPDLVCLFLKGKNVDSELTESEKNWTFRYKKTPSQSDDSGSVLIIRNLQHKSNAAKRRYR